MLFFKSKNRVDQIQIHDPRMLKNDPWWSPCVPVAQSAEHFSLRENKC